MPVKLLYCVCSTDEASVVLNLCFVGLFVFCVGVYVGGVFVFHEALLRTWA